MLKIALLMLLSAIPITVSPETTVVVKPLADDGLPDFGKALYQRLSKGGDPESNGAIPFWKAVGLRGLSLHQQALLVRALGCETPRSSTALKPLPRQIRGDDRVSVQYDAALRALISRPWSQSTCDSVGWWVNANRQGLDLLAEAGNRQVFYSPLPCLLQADPKPLLSATLYDVMAMRKHGRLLLVDAMHAGGVGNHDACYAVIRSTHGLARHFSRSFSGLGLLAGFTHSRAANRSALANLRRFDRVGLKGLITHTQDRLTHDSSWEKHYGENVSLLFVDVLLREFTHRPRAHRPPQEDDELRELYLEGRIDLNESLRALVSYGKEIDDVVRMQDSLARRQRCEEFLTKIDAIHPKAVQQEALANGATIPEANGVATGLVYVKSVMPDVESILLAADSALAVERLTSLSAALCIFWLDQKRYPESLKALSRDLLPNTYIDPFTNQPFRYERRDDGFLLYSLGINGEDDGANDRLGDFTDGEHAEVDWTNKRAPRLGADDIVVRLPIPKLELPTSAAQ